MTGLPFPTDTPFTLAQLRLIPELASVFDRIYPKDYDEFIDTLYSDLDKAIVLIEKNRDIRASDGEDRTTEEIVSYLKGCGYNASHNSFQSGHCDLTVESRSGMVWLGEAKKHKDYDYLWKGFQQLSTRYSTGTSASAAGGMLIYIRTQSHGSQVIEEWRKRLKAQALTDFADSDCARRPGLAFYSQHKHELSGLPYKVRHMGILMKFDPKDDGAKLNKGPAKTARKTKASKP